MPKGDRTGPWGYGSRTGRGLGYCAGYNSPGYTKGPGMGWGRGSGWGSGWRGGGRGFRWGFPSYYVPDVVPPTSTAFVPPWSVTLNPKDESKYLEQTLIGLKKEIDVIEKRLEELNRQKED